MAQAFAEFIGQFGADEFANQAQAHHLAGAPLNTIGQFVNCQQNVERQWMQELDHPVIGKYKAPGAPMRLSLTPMRVRRPAPTLDQQRNEILLELEKLPANTRENRQRKSPRADAHGLAYG